MRRISICLLILFTSANLVSCSTSAHEHYMMTRTIKEATCTTQGVVENYCSCGYSYTILTSYSYHDYDNGTVLEEPTCTQQGKKVYKCKVCGKEKSEILNAEHHFEVTGSSGDCHTDGRIQETCTVCGYQQIKDNPKGHDFVDDVCTKCGAVKATSITADTWYIYQPLDILQVQNCTVESASSARLGRAVMVSYHPICKECHILNTQLHLAGPEVDYPVSRLYTCPDCGATTTIRLELQ